MRSDYVVLMGALVLSACGTTTNIERGSDARLREAEAIALIGVNPRYRVHLVRGAATDGVWNKPFNDVPEGNLFPEGGYIVVRLAIPKPGEKWSVPIVMPQGIGGPVYLPCDGSIAPTFALKGGAVNYVGDISYTYSGDRLTFDISSNEEAARQFLASNYPQLLKTLYVSAMTPMKVKTTACDPKTITVPIYLPAK